jgi:hypothetical protein
VAALARAGGRHGQLEVGPLLHAAGSRVRADPPEVKAPRRASTSCATPTTPRSRPSNAASCTDSRSASGPRRSLRITERPATLSRVRRALLWCSAARRASRRCAATCAPPRWRGCPSSTAASRSWARTASATGGRAPCWPGAESGVTVDRGREARGAVSSFDRTVGGPSTKAIVWVSLGEPKDLGGARPPPRPLPGQPRGAGAHGQSPGEVHALPAGPFTTRTPRSAAR